jgi:hypothetical protein
MGKLVCGRLSVALYSINPVLVEKNTIFAIVAAALGKVNQAEKGDRLLFPEN